MTCTDCFTRKFHGNKVVTVGEYGNVLWNGRPKAKRISRKLAAVVR